MPNGNTALIIVSRRPGMFRGGRAHPPVAEYALDAFTHEQLADIVGEPEMSVVVGQLLTPDIMAARAPKPEPEPEPEPKTRTPKK